MLIVVPRAQIPPSGPQQNIPAQRSDRRDSWPRTGNRGCSATAQDQGREVALKHARPIALHEQWNDHDVHEPVASS